MSDQIRVIDRAARCVAIQNGYEHGEIFIRHGSTEDRDGRAQNWVTFACHTTFGAYSNHWSHIGSNDWRKFIQNGQLDHVMNKFCPGKWDEPDFEATADGFKDTLIEARRAGLLEKDEAREAWGRLDDAIGAARNYESVPDAAVAMLLDHVAGEDWTSECWEDVKRRPNGQVKGFFERIWTPFCEDMARELAAEREAEPAEEAPA